MAKAVAIDPGTSKCGFIFADLKQKKVLKAEVVESDQILICLKKICQNHHDLQLLIGNGTSSTKYINELSGLFPELIIAQEKNSTFRAKQRYFEIFPLVGLKCFFPRDIFILNKNLDALAALIIMEDYYECKFEMSKSISIKTWLK